MVQTSRMTMYATANAIAPAKSILALTSPGPVNECRVLSQCETTVQVAGPDSLRGDVDEDIQSSFLVRQLKSYCRDAG